jgi:hypothetical protein
MVGTIVLAVLWAFTGWLFHGVCKRYDKRFNALEHENLIIVKALTAQSKRVEAVEEDARKALEIALECRNKLTEEPEKTKTEPKPPVPKRVNWMQARAALEKSTLEEEQP